MVEIRPMGKGDHNQVRTMELFCIREYIERELDKSLEDLPSELLGKLGASGSESFDHFIGTGLSFVALEEDHPVGFIFAQILHHVYNTKDLVWVENFGVHPNYRRSGVGYRMLERVVEDGREMGAQAVYSAIMPDNIESILLHKKMGFFVDARKVALLDLEAK